MIKLVTSKISDFLYARISRISEINNTYFCLNQGGREELSTLPSAMFIFNFSDIYIHRRFYYLQFREVSLVNEKH